MAIRHGLSTQSAPWGNLKDKVDADHEARLTALEGGLLNLTNQMSSGFQQIGNTLQAQTQPQFVEAFKSGSLGSGPGDDPLELTLATLILPEGYSRMEVLFTVAVTITGGTASGTTSVYTDGLGVSSVESPYASSTPYVTSGNGGYTLVPSGGTGSFATTGVLSTAFDAPDLGLTSGSTAYLVFRLDAASSTSGSTIVYQANASSVVIFTR